jgi:hypothetical protein
VTNELVVEEERAPGASLVRRPCALGDERAVRHADGRHVQHRTEVQREARPARMVAPGRVDEEHLRRFRERADRGLQQGSFAESQQARLVGSGGAAGHGDGLAARARSCPRPVSGAAGPAAAAGEADEDRAEPRAGLEPPQQGVERGQAQLLLDELLAGARPLAHALILGRATVSVPRERRVSMCWSKHEREQWERELREAELEAERRRIATSEPAEEPEPVAESEEREPELVRA